MYSLSFLATASADWGRILFGAIYWIGLGVPLYSGRADSFSLFRDLCVVNSLGMIGTPLEFLHYEYPD